MVKQEEVKQEEPKQEEVHVGLNKEGVVKRLRGLVNPHSAGTPEQQAYTVAVVARHKEGEATDGGPAYRAPNYDPDTESDDEQ